MMTMMKHRALRELRKSNTASIQHTHTYTNTNTHTHILERNAWNNGIMPHWHAKHSGPGFACPFCAATERFGFWSFLSACHASEMIQLRDVLSAADEPEESPEPSEQSVGSARISDAPRDDEATLEILDWRKRDREREKKNLKKRGHQKAEHNKLSTHTQSQQSGSLFLCEFVCCVHALYIISTSIWYCHLLPVPWIGFGMIWRSPLHIPLRTLMGFPYSILSMGFLCHHVYTSSYEVVVSAVTGKTCEQIGPRLLQIVSSGLPWTFGSCSQMSCIPRHKESST